MNKATQNPDGEVELTRKMDGMGACLLSDAVAKTAEGMMRLADANIELDKETIQGVFTLMAHASQMSVTTWIHGWQISTADSSNKKLPRRVELMSYRE